jgi:transposase
VAYHYIGGMRDQQFLMPVDMADWLDEGHLAWFIIDVVDRIDTSGLHALHPNDGAGRPAYDPDMMLALLLYAYATSTRSSRRIEQLCVTDAAYKVIAGGVAPDHATIARFLVNHQQALHTVFVQVLSLCAEAGLLDLSLVAVDGTKLGTDAALDRNRTAGWIRDRVEQILTEAREADQLEAAAPAGLFDLGKLPGELSTRDGRLQRLTAALEHVEAAEAAAHEQAQQRQAKALAEAAQGRRLRGRKPKDPHAALVRAQADEAATRHQAQIRAARRTDDDAAIEAAVDTDPQVTEAVAATTAARAAAKAAHPEAFKANITDPESRIMSTATGWVQGYNAQAVVTQDQIIIAGHVCQDRNDVGLYQPMIAQTRAILDRIGINDPIGLVLADAGYWSIDNATAQGPDRLIATDKTHKLRQAARELGTTSGDPPEDATEAEKMEHRLRTKQGMVDYTKRSHTVEPAFSFKANHGYTRFRRRGLAAASSEWSLLTTVHNLRKLHRAS